MSRGHRSHLQPLFAAVLCAAMFAAAANAGTWNKVAQFTKMGRVSASFFFNDKLGFIGFNGSVTSSPIKRTSDGGATWTDALTPTLLSSNVWVSDIWFTNACEGWATFFYTGAGGGGGLWHTTDAGFTWQAAGATGGLASVRQTSNAVIVTQYSSPVGIMLSTDRGKTFPTQIAIRNNGIDFVDDLHGAISGFSTDFFYTYDGGITWHTSNTSLSNEAWGVYGIKGTSTFISVPEDPSVITTGSKVCVSTDYGVNWNVINTLSFKSNGGIAGSGQNIYIQATPTASGPFGLFVSTDIGKNWNSVGGPVEDFDARFSVTDCAVFAFDEGGGVWMMSTGASCISDGLCDATHYDVPDTLRPLVSTLCDTVARKYFLRVPTVDTVAILDLRILDSLRIPSTSHAFHLDSIPNLVHMILPKDSMAIVLGWTPRKMMDSTSTDSAVVRLIYYDTHYNRRDTLLLHIHLTGISVAPQFALSTHSIRNDTLNVCSMLDTALSLTNNGCDTMQLTQVFLDRHKEWSFGDSSGKPLSLPQSIAPGDHQIIHIHFTPDGAGPVSDLLHFKLRQQAKDTSTQISLEAQTRSGSPLATPDTVYFSPLATCVHFDTLIDIRNSGCDTIVILSSSGLSSNDWTLLDTNGAALKLPLRIPRDSTRRLLLRFAPHNTGPTSGLLQLGFHYFDFSLTKVIVLRGAGSIAGELAYTKSQTVTTNSWCDPVENTFSFHNTTCIDARIDSIVMAGKLTFLDSALLPLIVPSSGIQYFKFRYTPTKRAQNEPDSVPIVLYVNGNIVHDTIVFFCNALPGSSIFQSVDSILLDTITQCDRTSRTFTLRNSGCDILEIDSIASSLDLQSSSSLPIVLRGGDSVHITVSASNLPPGDYRDSIRFCGVHANAALLDTAILCALTVRSAEHILALDTTPINLGTAYSCDARDTTIVFTNMSCVPETILGWRMKNWIFNIYGNGTFPPLILPPGGSDSLHIVLWHSDTGKLIDTAVIISNADSSPIRYIPVTITVPPLDSIYFRLATTSSTVDLAQTTDVSILPDRVVAGKGLHSVSGILDYYSDAFEIVSIAPMPNANFQRGNDQQTGRHTRIPFELTSTTELTIDPSTPLLRLQLKATITDSIVTSIALDSVRFNADDPKYGDCTLAIDSKPVVEQLVLNCGDDLLVRSLSGNLVLAVGHPRPNPVGSRTGYAIRFPITSEIAGTVEIQLFDALGRIREQLDVPIQTKSHSEPLLDLSALPSGFYHYSIQFVNSNETVTRQTMGSISLVR